MIRGHSLGHQIGLGGLGPLFADLPAERAVPETIRMAFDQEALHPIAAKPCGVRIEDLRIYRPKASLGLNPSRVTASRGS
jgi:hypothetical protein